MHECKIRLLIAKEGGNGRRWHSSLRSDGDGLPAQRRVEQLLDRRIEGIQVCMEDGCCRFHPDRSPVTFREVFSVEHNENTRCRRQAARGARLPATIRRALVEPAKVRFVSPSFERELDRRGTSRSKKPVVSMRRLFVAFEILGGRYRGSRPRADKSAFPPLVSSHAPRRSIRATLRPRHCTCSATLTLLVIPL